MKMIKRDNVYCIILGNNAITLTTYIPLKSILSPVQYSLEDRCI